MRSGIGGGIAVTVAAAVATLPTARAEDAGARGAAAFATIEEITVFGAARDERALLDTPNAVSVVGEQEILRRQPSTYEELIGDLPGVTIDGGPRGVSQEPNIRGFQDEQVVIRTDGARQNFNVAHRGRFFLDPQILKQVEVLRGGNSTLFGSGALGGVIFLDTKDATDLLEPGESWGGEVRLGFDSQGDEIQASGALAARAGQFDALAFLSGRPRFSDLTDGDGDPILDSDIDSLTGLFKLGWEPGDGHRIEASYQHYRDSGDTPPNTNVQGSETTTVDRNLRYHSARLGWDWAPADSDLIDLSVLGYYNRTEVDEDRLFDGRFDATTYETLGFEATNVSRFDLGLPVALSYGVEIYRDEQTATRDGLPRPQAPDASQSFVAGFVQADIALADRLTLTPGIRYDHYSLDPDGAFDDRSEGQASPKLALSWRPVDAAQLWVSGSQSFRAASLTELYPTGEHFAVQGFSLGPGTYFTGINEFQPNPDLDPERASQIEIGGRYEFRDAVFLGDRLSLEATGYYADVDDYISQTVLFIDFDTGVFNPASGLFEVGGSTSSSNVDAKLFGFEAAITYDSARWFGGVGLTIPRGRGDDGEKLGSIPQDRLVVTAGYRPAPDWELGARGTFASGINADDVPPGALTTPGFAVFDLFVNWVPSSGPLEGAVFAAGIDNVTDRDYRIHPNGLDSPGIAFKVSGGFRF
ncbi:TonB-dependent hemoglobin/transferrin/lactoferrin family receptor [Paralimibaculum aggregatum]|uniref:TonB-dependent hemoglobin/transferrin/lactoferrin family receptor n=1 Tax=Paralimibaculum aggregatum TaxID=3036245 RepID=A0ABQ6LQR3_9RHOB|nr:TonB-dependent hemoglobin/transferrin/lactoferrin family receptor [Limibaculum sp. NKW23]GMG83528.1 TonB-dependent hemoglobin/transferrin/lactoferrin family receptor [Limibaculum sp. NKW23]